MIETVGPVGLEPTKRVAQLIYSQSPLPLGTRTHERKPQVGFEPTTTRLQGGRSATELLWRDRSIISLALKAIQGDILAQHPIMVAILAKRPPLVNREPRRDGGEWA